jgi:carbonic anhydrase
MKNVSLLFSGLFIMLFLVSSCKKDEEDFCETYEWEYEGESDPDTWFECNPDCDGEVQSPINITTTATVINANLDSLDIEYENSPIDVYYNGHTVEYEYEAGSKLVLNGVDYNLLQFHFHTLSEHTVNGQHYAMEVHMVHQDPISENLAVIGVFVEEGNENTFLSNFSGNVPTVKDQHYIPAGGEANAIDFLPIDRGYYTYSGSLTTPPCSEIATWFLMKDPVQASAAQISELSAILQDNYRPTQALNGRVVREF